MYDFDLFVYVFVVVFFSAKRCYSSREGYIDVAYKVTSRAGWTLHKFDTIKGNPLNTDDYFSASFVKVGGNIDFILRSDTSGKSIQYRLMKFKAQYGMSGQYSSVNIYGVIKFTWEARRARIISVNSQEPCQ